MPTLPIAQARYTPPSLPKQARWGAVRPDKGRVLAVFSDNTAQPTAWRNSHEYGAVPTRGSLVCLGSNRGPSS
jgi:hypothetical protein